eukprot:7131711-Heterocapsa_arctica.AAC.1
MAPCCRSDVRRGARIADRGLRVEDRDLHVEDRDPLAEDRPVMAGSCVLPADHSRLRWAHAALPCRVPAPVVDVVPFPLDGRVHDIDRSVKL